MRLCNLMVIALKFFIHIFTLLTTVMQGSRRAKILQEEEEEEEEEEEAEFLAHFQILV